MHFRCVSFLEQQLEEFERAERERAEERRMQTKKMLERMKQEDERLPGKLDILILKWS
jgi:hypothetical protein